MATEDQLNPIKAETTEDLADFIVTHESEFELWGFEFMTYSVKMMETDIAF